MRIERRSEISIFSSLLRSWAQKSWNDNVHTHDRPVYDFGDEACWFGLSQTVHECHNANQRNLPSDQRRRSVPIFEQDRRTTECSSDPLPSSDSRYDSHLHHATCSHLHIFSTRLVHLGGWVGVHLESAR